MYVAIHPQPHSPQRDLKGRNKGTGRMWNFYFPVFLWLLLLSFTWEWVGSCFTKLLKDQGKLSLLFGALYCFLCVRTSKARMFGVFFFWSLTALSFPFWLFLKKERKKGGHFVLYVFCWLLSSQFVCIAVQLFLTGQKSINLPHLMSCRHSIFKKIGAFTLPLSEKYRFSLFNVHGSWFSVNIFQTCCPRTFYLLIHFQ